MQTLATTIYTPQGFTKTPPSWLRSLDIGCGARKLPGSTGIDCLPMADIQHDLNVYPWPIENNTYDLVFANHYLEHAHDILKTLGEVHRILVPGGHFIVQVPYFRSIDAYGDPTHQHYFTRRSLNCVIEGTEERKYAYTNFTFKEIGFWYGWPTGKSRIKKLLTLNPDFYDQYLSLAAPVACLTWELLKVDKLNPSNPNEKDY